MVRSQAASGRHEASIRGFGTGHGRTSRGVVVMRQMSPERERDQHKISGLTVIRGGPYLPAGTLVITTAVRQELS
jgi:hypothetical protein